MRFSNFLPALGGLASLVDATPTFFGGGAGLSGSFSGKKTSCSLDNSWKDHVLFQGHGSVEAGTSAAISLGLNLPSCQISGDVGFQLVSNFLSAPSVRVSLGGIKSYVEVDLSASAGIQQSVELFTSGELELIVPGLSANLGAAVALDLIVGCGAAVDLSAGVYVEFAESAYIDISLLTKEVVGLNLDGLVTKALPLAVGAEVDLGVGIDLNLGLRLRNQITCGAGVSLPILNIGAGAGFGAAIWVNLFDYAAVITGSGSAGISITGDFSCNVGLAFDSDLDLSLGGGLKFGAGLDLGLVPSASVDIAKGTKTTYDQKDRGTCGRFIGDFKKGAGGDVEGPTITQSGLITASGVHTGGADVSVSVEVPDVSASAGLELGGDVTLSADLPGVTASGELGVSVSGGVGATISGGIGASVTLGHPGVDVTASLDLPGASVGVSGGFEATGGLDISVSGGLGASVTVGHPGVDVTASIEVPGVTGGIDVSVSGGLDGHISATAGHDFPYVSIPGNGNGTATTVVGNKPGSDLTTASGDVPEATGGSGSDDGENDNDNDNDDSHDGEDDGEDDGDDNKDNGDDENDGEDDGSDDGDDNSDDGEDNGNDNEDDGKDNGDGSDYETGSDSKPVATTSADDSLITQVPDASGMITSTVRETRVYTITKCAVNVINCPAKYTQKIILSTVMSTVTVCPATATATAVPVATDSNESPDTPAVVSSKPVAVTVTVITTDVTTLQPCTKLVTKTVEVPSNAPSTVEATVTVTNQVTVPNGAAETSIEQAQPLSTFSRVVSATATGSYAVPTHGAGQDNTGSGEGSDGTYVPPVVTSPASPTEGLEVGETPSATPIAVVGAGSALKASGAMLFVPLIVGLFL